MCRLTTFSMCSLVMFLIIWTNDNFRMCAHSCIPEIRLATCQQNKEVNILCQYVIFAFVSNFVYAATNTHCKIQTIFVLSSQAPKPTPIKESINKNTTIIATINIRQGAVKLSKVKTISTVWAKHIAHQIILSIRQKSE